MIGKSAHTDLVHARGRTCDCANASRVSCVQSTSSHVSVPSTEWQRLIATTADRSRLTDFEVLLLKDPTKFGPPTPLASSLAKVGYILLPSWMSSPAA